MAITEEQRIEFIIAKIDMYLDEYKEVPIKDAIDSIFQKHLNDDEKKNYKVYFYKLYKSYLKYRHLNLIIDYRKTIIDLEGKEETVTGLADRDDAKDIFSSVSSKEIDEIDVVNQTELIKLRSFGIRAAILVFIIGITIYLGLLSLLTGNYTEILVKLYSTMAGT